jgi:hypothetical protein
MEKPLDGMLNRGEAKKHADENFGNQIALVQDLANYGSNLILRAFNSSNKDLASIVACGILLKQVVAMLDAVYELVAAGMVYPSFLPARAAFEASVYLDWILFSDSERKARAYLVSNYRDERIWVARVTKGTHEESVFSAISKSIGLDIHARRPTLEAEAREHLKEVNRILSQTNFANMDQEFEKLKKKRKREPSWVQVCGANNIRAVADQVGRIAEYSFFYSRGSQITHSATYKDHVKFAKDKVHLKPIRNLSGVDMLINFLVSIALRSYQNVLTYYRPKELDAFKTKYKEDWRDPFLSVKGVTYRSK